MTVATDALSSLQTLDRLTSRPMGGIATSSTQMKGGLGQLFHVCVSCTWKPFEPFEPYLHSATAQAQIGGSNEGSR